MDKIESAIIKYFSNLDRVFHKVTPCLYKNEKIRKKTHTHNEFDWYIKLYTQFCLHYLSLILLPTKMRSLQLMLSILLSYM